MGIDETILALRKRVRASRGAAQATFTRYAGARIRSELERFPGIMLLVGKPGWVYIDI
jgi:hypothetical protein